MTKLKDQVNQLSIIDKQYFPLPPGFSIPAKADVEYKIQEEAVSKTWLQSLRMKPPTSGWE